MNRAIFLRTACVAGLLLAQGCTQVAKTPSVPVAASAATCPPPAPALTPDVLATLRVNAKNLGPLWRVEKGGRVSWLYGTIHVGRLEWQVPGEKVAGALAASDTLALEVDINRKSELERTVVKPAAAASSAVAAVEPVPENLAKQIDLFCSYAKTAPGWYDNWLAKMTMTDFVVWMQKVIVQKEGLYDAYGLEYVLARAAADSSKTLVGLEKAEERQAYFLHMSALGDTMKNELSKASRANSSAQPQPVGKFTALEVLFDETVVKLVKSSTLDIAKSWANARLTDCLIPGSWCAVPSSPSVNEAKRAQLNAERESRMADAFDRLHQSGQRVFAAVGMSHVQPSRLPALLKAKGFNVQFVEN